MVNTQVSENRLWEWLPPVASIAVVIGFFYSTIAMSLGMMVMLFSSVYGLSEGRIRLRAGTRSRVREFFTHIRWYGPALGLLAVIISGLWSANVGDWMDFARLKLPLLALPLSFCLWPGWREGRFNHLEGIFVAVAVISTLPVLAQLFTDFDAIAESMKKGQAIPTPVHHVRYSIMLALAALLSFYRSFQLDFSREKWIRIFGGLWLLSCLLVLSSRMGVVLFVAGAGYLGLWLVFVRGQWRTVLLSLFVLGTISVLAYQSLPTVKNKLSYTFYDWKQMGRSDARHYSDGERIRSVKMGVDLWREAPLAGVGMGDLKQKSRSYYKDKLGLDYYKLPHNQWVFVLSGAGLIGLVLLLTGTFGPLWSALWFREPAFVLLYIVLLVSGIAEHSLETSLGVTLLGFFHGYYTAVHHTVWSDIQR